MNGMKLHTYKILHFKIILIINLFPFLFAFTWFSKKKIHLIHNNCQKNENIWWSEMFFLVIWSEIIVKCVIRFGRFVRILEMLERDHCFQCSAEYGCVSTKISFCKSMGSLDLGIWSCFLLAIDFDHLFKIIILVKSNQHMTNYYQWK